MVQEGRFRDDLFYRLNVIPLTLPPLRDRVDDLAYLIEHFLEKYRRLTRKPITQISDNAYDLLMAYHYHGNVRELENIIEHAFVRINGNIITENKLPVYLRQAPSAGDDSGGDGGGGRDEESLQVRRALMQCHWNRNKTACQLGISRTTLWRRMRQFDLLNENDSDGMSSAD
ncbi:sigma-54-dependent Fis family transcriptional regulator, partial [bacterium]|nr:sigma-54-dependent Fis family transcriptional regulator [bacterium]